MKIIDLHCDTALNFVGDKKYSLKSNPCAVDIDKLQKANSIAQFFACFVFLKENPDPYLTYLELVKEIKNQIEENKSYIKLATNYRELIENEKAGLISAFLTIEEGGALKGDINNLYKAYEEGVRLITLTWNFENEIGFPGCELSFVNSGLKDFGIEVVSKMNDLGMIIDVSHLSDGGFYDVAKFSTKPFVASHSNARSICNHTRNLNDDMIRVLAEKGGVMGINFEKEFISDSGITTVDKIITQIKHIYNIGGIDVVSLGSDFDGIDSREYEISHIGDIDKLVQGLYKSGFKTGEIEKICYGNNMRIIREVMK